MTVKQLKEHYSNGTGFIDPWSDFCPDGDTFEDLGKTLGVTTTQAQSLQAGMTGRDPVLPECEFYVLGQQWREAGRVSELLETGR